MGGKDSREWGKKREGRERGKERAQRLRRRKEREGEGVKRRDPAGQKTRAEGKSELSLYFNLRWEESKKRSARHCVTL